MPYWDNDKNEIEDLSTDKILEEIEQDKKQVKKSSVFAIAALIAIIALCIAWFVMNNLVKGTTSGVSAEDDNPFTLASVGNRASAESNYLKDENGTNLLTEGFSQEYDKYVELNINSGKAVEVQKKQTYYTGTSSLAWHLSGRQSLVPGTGDKLEFYLIPKKNGLTSAKISLNMTGYTNLNNRAVKLNNEKIQNLISGHILLFKSLDDEYGYTGWLEEGTDGTYSFQVNAPTGTTFEKGVPYKISVYWVWPRYFRNYIYTQRSTQEDLFTNKIEQGPDSEYAKLIQFINNQKSFQDDGKLFYKEQNGEETDNELIGETEEINNQMSDSLLDKCSRYYNQADEYIGKNTKYVYVEMKVD